MVSREFLGFSVAFHRCAIGFLELSKYFLWLALIFKDCLQIYIYFRCSSVICHCFPRFSGISINFMHVRCFSLICNGFPRFSVKSHRCSSICYRISLFFMKLHTCSMLFKDFLWKSMHCRWFLFEFYCVSRCSLNFRRCSAMCHEFSSCSVTFRLATYF